MIETYYAGAYWAARQESAEECARRAHGFFELMARCEPLFSRWCVPPQSRKQEPIPFTLEVPTLREMFAHRRVLNDEKKVIEDLGFNISVSSCMPGQHQSDSAHLRVRCGVYAEPVGNACVLNLPSSGPHLKRIVAAPMLVEIMRAMAVAWDPGWGVATSHEHVEMGSERAIIGSFVGWVMYFSRQLGSVPPLPDPVRVEPVGNKGTLVILTPERFTASNPEHVALAARVRELLSQAGLLKPLY